MGKLTFSRIKNDVELDCGNEKINDIVKDSYFIMLLQEAYTYEIKYENTVVGYYMLNFRSIDFDKFPEDSKITDYSTDSMGLIPAVNIAFIAIDTRYQRKGFGKLTIEHIIEEVRDKAKSLPIRIVSLDAVVNKHQFYLNLGFKDLDYNKKDFEIPMFFDLFTDEQTEQIEQYELENGV